jgi:hypothetical protein
MSTPNGYVIYSGPSMLDGAPIVAIATMKTSNRKTGDMVQTWILRADMSPTAASKAGADASICGNCPQRWHLGGACYVNIGQGPGAVWRAWQRGCYQDMAPTKSPLDGQWWADQPGLESVGAGRRVRLGAYGDPAAVPTIVWRALVRYAAGHTGYTHQWRRPEAAALRELCMASVDSAEELHAAQSDGWRTFRVTDPAEIFEPGEIECAADARGISCADCLACDGATIGRPEQASIAITVHGSLASRFKARPVGAIA